VGLFLDSTTEQSFNNLNLHRNTEDHKDKLMLVPRYSLLVTGCRLLVEDPVFTGIACLNPGIWNILACNPQLVARNPSRVSSFQFQLSKPRLRHTLLFSTLRTNSATCSAPLGALLLIRGISNNRDVLETQSPVRKLSSSMARPFICLSI